MPRPSRKRQVADAALAEFAERGFSVTRVHDVAARAGMSDAALYRHYPSLATLGAELWTENFTLYSNRIAGVISPDVEASLRGIVRETLAVYRENPDGFLFSLQLLPAFIRDLPAGFAFPLERIESVIRRGQADGTVRRGRTNILAAMFLGALLRPIELTKLAAPGALDLLNDRSSDSLIEDAARAVLAAA
ncbi:MAG: TetR/AcrR family transcriptional regulator [Actinomycetota bacterium]